MSPEQVRKSIETGELQLSAWEKFTHYGILYFLFSIPGFVLLFHFIDLFNEKPFRHIEGEVLLLLIPSTLGAFAYYIQKRRLRFRSVTTSLTREELDQIIENIARELEWLPFVVRKDLVIAKTRPSFFSGSWGEQITIIFHGNTVLINSICDPDQRSSISSMGRNRKNMNRFIEAIERSGHEPK